MTNRERNLEAELQAAQAQLERLYAALDDAAVGLWEWDCRTDQVRWSELLEQMAGLSPGSFPGTLNAYLQCLHPEDRDPAQQTIARALKYGERYTMEHRFQRPDGTICWIEGRGQACYDAEGRLVGLRGVVLDITARKQAEAAQREAERRFTSFMDHIPAAAFVKDEASRYLYVNRHLRETFQSEWLGRTDCELFSEEMAQQIQAHDQSVLTENRSVEFVETIPTYAGKQSYWRGVKFPFTDATGQRFLGGVAIDVTQHHRLEARKTEFQALGQALNTATTPEEAARIILDCADRLLGWDACWLELYDPNTETIRTLAITDIVNGERKDLQPGELQPATSTLTRRVRDEGPFLRLRTPEILPMQLPEEHEPFGDVTRPSASILCVPIRWGAQIQGAMSIQSYRFYAYDEEALQTLQALADYCAGALERTRAEAERRQLEEQFRQS